MLLRVSPRVSFSLTELEFEGDEDILRSFRLRMVDHARSSSFAPCTHSNMQTSCMRTPHGGDDWTKPRRVRLAKDQLSRLSLLEKKNKFNV